MQLHEEIRANQAQLWGLKVDCIVVACWLTRINETNGTKWGEMIAAGHPLDLMLDAYRAHTEPWFKREGCEYIRLIGRKGWTKIFSDYSFEAVLMVKRLA